MPKPRRRNIAGTALLALLCALLLLPAAAPAATRHQRVRAHLALGYTAVSLTGSTSPRAHIAQAGCPGADLMPAAGNLAAVRGAVLCLYNQVRVSHGLPQLRQNARLRRAATSHTADMIKHHFFEHTAPGGATMVDRIFRAHYARRDQAWAFGENLAWGSGRLATAQGVFEQWMRSPGHRANILRRSYRELGVGVMAGVPGGGSAGATYTTDFGVKR
jgi:uncharacterized protein YkwD